MVTMKKLVDRQTIIDTFCSQCTVDKPETCSTLRYGDKWCNEVYTILNAPTVDAVPVVHGHWIYHPDWQADGECGYECSECGRGVDLDYAYCPHCGARMNGAMKV